MTSVFCSQPQHWDCVTGHISVKCGGFVVGGHFFLGSWELAVECLAGRCVNCVFTSVSAAVESDLTDLVAFSSEDDSLITPTCW